MARNYKYSIHGDSNTNEIYDDFEWVLECGPHDEEKEEKTYYVKCFGPTNDLWNINATVTLDCVELDGTKGITESIDFRFNNSNPQCELYISTSLSEKDFDEKYPTLKIDVKINSFTGVQVETDNVEFDKKDDQLSDVALVVEGKKLYVNKAVLATFSPVFRAMFFSGFKESTDKEVEIKDVEYDDFEEFLQVIYTAYPHIDGDNVKSILILADRFDVKIVMEKCENYLLWTEDVSDAEKLRLAETYTFPDVHEQTMDSIDTKEKLTDICKYTSEFGPMTLQAIIRKMLDLQMNQ